MTELNNKNIFVLQIGASLCYKLGQLCFITNKGNVVSNWGNFIFTNSGKYCYKLGQPLLQSRAAVTSWGKIYYKLRQALQIGA